MEWITLTENDNYEISSAGDVRYKPKGTPVKVTGNHFAVYKNDKKTVLNVRRLLLKYFNLGIQNLEGEIWKEIPGFEGLYSVSNLSRVKSHSRMTSNYLGRYSTVDKIMPGTVSNGYYIITFRKDGRISYPRVHRLIATSFIDNPFGKPEVNHIDGNKLNNKIENLEWCTGLENKRHAFRTGLNKGAYSKQKRLGLFKSRAKRQPKLPCPLI